MYVLSVCNPAFGCQTSINLCCLLLFCYHYQHACMRLKVAVVEPIAVLHLAECAWLYVTRHTDTATTMIGSGSPEIM